MKTELFKPEEFELCVFVWTENILKTELFKKDAVTIIMRFPSSSLPQAQIQNVSRVLDV